MRNNFALLRRCLVLAAIVLAGFAAHAELAAGVFVKVGDAEHAFAVSDVKEITFGDSEVTVVKTDDVALTFAGDWFITFGETDASGITDIELTTSDSPAVVYDINGVMLLQAESLSALELQSLPSGVYIINTNGKSIKIKK